jgi:hypothetical protein
MEIQFDSTVCKYHVKLVPNMAVANTLNFVVAYLLKSPQTLEFFFFEK